MGDVYRKRESSRKAGMSCPVSSEPAYGYFPVILTPDPGEIYHPQRWDEAKPAPKMLIQLELRKTDFLRNKCPVSLEDAHVTLCEQDLDPVLLDAVSRTPAR